MTEKEMVAADELDKKMEELREKHVRADVTSILYYSFGNREDDAVCSWYVVSDDFSVFLKDQGEIVRVEVTCNLWGRTQYGLKIVTDAVFKKFYEAICTGKSHDTVKE